MLILTLSTADGTVVMETMDSGNPDHEMINMYHLGGNEFVLTHYCAGNNQPIMRLVMDPRFWTTR